ncbi:acetyl-CoA carboxylase biotin carboxyl carrier protein subunit, partial [Burkholderia diffusa]|uniref:acetyl-CoA carboxylase biotin carboxyl carrier protein subunit n=1 Tax=Burkholderia diffusa TaxID=488732 RepID=UPI0012F3E466
ALSFSALLARERDAAARQGASPWRALPDWRLNGGYRRTLEWHAPEREADVTVTYEDDGGSTRLATGDAAAQPFAWTRGATPLDFDVTLDGVRSSGRVYADGDSFHVFTQGVAETFEWRNVLAHAGDAEHGGGRLTAPMPGKVIAVLVEPGQKVEAGTPLIVMEAMKMEHTIGAPGAGVVAEVLYGVGDQVADGAQLLMMAEG